MDLARVDGGLPGKAAARANEGGDMEVEEEGMEESPPPHKSPGEDTTGVPRLRFHKVRALKKCLLDAASKEGEVGPETVGQLFAAESGEKTYSFLSTGRSLNLFLSSAPRIRSVCL